MGLTRSGLLFGLALLIALVLPATGHGDFFISNFNSTFILTDHPNFYRALADEPTAVFPTGLSGGPYGPLFYYPTAAWLGALDKIHLIDIHAWNGSSAATLQSFPTILALKLPNLAVYLLVALVIGKTLRGGRGEVASWLWLANPAVIVFTLMMGQNDAEAVPYRGPAEPQAVAPGDRFSFFLISSNDDLRTITFWVESGGGPAALEVSDGTGRAPYADPARPLVAGANPVGRVEDAAGRSFLLAITPASAIRMRMVQVPRELVVSSAALNGSPLPGTAAFSAHYETTWGRLLGDAGTRVRHEWWTLAVSVAVCAAAFAMTWVVMIRTWRQEGE